MLKIICDMCGDVIEEGQYKITLLLEEKQMDFCSKDCLRCFIKENL